jgi:dihydropteroate synthase
MRGEHVWNITEGVTLGPARFLVAGIVNATPDSFHPGGRCPQADEAVGYALSLAREGAHILDVGGESTRPGAEPVAAGEELRRVLPVVRELAAKKQESGASWEISVDTCKAEVARQALAAGARIINDVSAARWDPRMPGLLGQARPGYVLMHARGKPRDMQKRPVYDDVVDEIRAFFHARLRALTDAGLPEENIVLDPGIGFGKTLEHNLEILRRMESFAELGRPLYVGLSNKSLWGRLLGLDLGERGPATQAATALLAARGVFVHRVHEVARTVQTLAVTRALAPARAEQA